MLISRWMTRDPITIAPGQTLEDARQMMNEGRFRRLPVVENGRLVGIITDRDLRLEEYRQPIDQLKHIRVDSLMSLNVITATPQTLLDQAANMFVKHKVGGFPVMDNGKLVGIITTTDMLRAFGEVLGTAEEGVSRIDLAFTGNSFDVATIAHLIGLSGGEVLGMGTYAGENDRRDQVFYIRVRAEDAREIANLLTEKGFTVVAIHR